MSNFHILWFTTYQGSIYGHICCNNYKEVPSEVSTFPFQDLYSVMVLQLLAYAIFTTNDRKWSDICTWAPRTNFFIRDHSNIMSSCFWLFLAHPPTSLMIYSKVNHQKLTFSDPTHPLLWWLNTWMVPSAVLMRIHRAWVRNLKLRVPLIR